MNKKQGNSTAIIAAIGFFLVVIVGCILIFVDSSPKRTSTATPEYLPLQIQGWESEKIDTMCLEITQSYPEEWFGFFKETLTKLGINLTPRQFEFPYREILVEVLEQIDIQVVSDADQCQVVVIERRSVMVRAILERSGTPAGRRSEAEGATRG